MKINKKNDLIEKLLIVVIVRVQEDYLLDLNKKLDNSYWSEEDKSETYYEESDVYEAENNLTIKKSITECSKYYAEIFKLNSETIESKVNKIFFKEDPIKNKPLTWYKENDIVKVLEDYPLANIYYLAIFIANMNESDFDTYINNKSSYVIRQYKKVFPHEIEDLSKIYNLNILNPNRRAAKELRKLNSLANILIVIAYLILENLKFKKGHIKGIALILNKMISIPVPTLKVKISQIKNYAETGNTKQLSEGLICTYIQFKDISLNKMLQVLMEYQYFTDENIEARFLKLLEDSTYLDDITNNNIEIFDYIIKMWPYYTEEDYNNTFLVGTYYDG